MPEGEKRERIKIWMAACIVTLALFIDVIELVTTWLGIGIITSFVIVPPVTLIFWIWYKLLDIPFLGSPKKFATLAITCLVELIPALDAIPILSFGWTIGAIILIILVRLEDKGGVVGQLAGATTSIMSKRYQSYKSVFENPQELAKINKSFGKNIFAISKKELLGEVAKRNLKVSDKELEEMDQYLDKLPSKTQNILNLKNQNNKQQKAA